jgi:predicted RNase H-like nuclease
VIVFTGVDGCRFGWVAVTWSEFGLGVTIARNWAEVAVDAAAIVAVDIPIGLSDSGRRACDQAARALLPGTRKSSVFSAPRRYMLGKSWADANGLGKAREGVGLSKQSWHIGHKIAELDTALSPGDQDRILEAHPEVIFHRLNGWAPLPRKAGRDGRAARIELLRAAGLPDPAPLLDRYPRKDVKTDDVVDAAACALLAREIAIGRGRRVPDGEIPRDGKGLRMEIWY